MYSSFEFWVWNMRNLGDNFIRRAFIKAKSKLIASAFDSINNAELGIFSYSGTAEGEGLVGL